MRITVFCGSALGTEPAYREAAAQLGQWIARKGHALIYGGGNEGLMGILGREAFSNSARVIGVLPGNVPFICGRPQPYCTEVWTEADMAARKRRMLMEADAFIALPGGIGTMDEISEAITLTRIGTFRKPSVFLNVHGFYDPFRELMQRMEQVGFIRAEEMEYVLFSEDLDEISDYFERMCL